MTWPMGIRDMNDGWDEIQVASLWEARVIDFKLWREPTGADGRMHRSYLPQVLAVAYLSST